MNLEKLNLVELDAQEVVEVDGGLIVIYPDTYKKFAKSVLGFFAGIADGYNEGLKD